MTYTIALAQVKHPLDHDPLRQVNEYAARAANLGADILVFPESLMTPYTEERHAFLKAAEPADGPFASGVRDAAARTGLWIAFTMNELNPADPERPFNTAALVDGDGALRGTYRKTHLFDVDFTRESDRMTPGDVLFSPVEAPFATIGLATCYDLRFPEVARTMALAGATLLLYPASWVAGPGKIEQWRTLLAARAIENELFVAGVSRADDTRIGHSCIIGPRGQLLAEGGPGEELVIASVDPADIETTRAAMPVFQHRRAELYHLD
ncbi:MAG: carbon-nitrogen hydrolase family protein [Eggerthellaceae bacterium]|jgi:predicted amidohydrolase